MTSDAIREGRRSRADAASRPLPQLLMSQDLSPYPAPLAWLCKETLSAHTWMISMEGMVVMGPHSNFVNGVAAIFAAYYVFNLQYPKGLKHPSVCPKSILQDQLLARQQARAETQAQCTCLHTLKKTP